MTFLGGVIIISLSIALQWCQKVSSVLVTVNFDKTGSVQSHTTPSTVTEITFDVAGATAGGGGTLGTPGKGARVIATIIFPPNTVINFFVGGKGGDSSLANDVLVTVIPGGYNGG